jgi:hypothetical protein
MAQARYDGHADWYDESIAAYSATATPLLLRLVGTDPGNCLDVGCGTGAHRFTGPLAEQPRGDGAWIVHPGYRTAK